MAAAEIEEVKGESDGYVALQLLRKVSKKLGNYWKELGREMGIQDAKIDSIYYTFSGDLHEMAYQVLIAWRQKVGRKATVSALQNYLENIERNDVVAYISEIWHPEFYDHTSGEDIATEIDATQHGINLLKEVKEKRMEEYLELKMNGLPWMQDLVLTLDEYYVDLSLMKMDKRGMELPQSSIKIDEIFSSTDISKKLSRILIEGGPGMGKSTLAAKLAYDWAKRENYLKHFDLVVLIPLRHSTGGLRGMICDAIHINQQDYKPMLRIIGDTSKEILFIMDGYDEISVEIEAVILPILKKEVYSHTTVVVTSRPGKFPTNRAEIDVTKRQETADFSLTFSHFIQKRISLKGFSSEQQKTFVKSHTKTCSVKEIRTIELKLNKLVDKDFLRCPLFLLMLIVTFTADYNTENPSETKTELYKQIFNCVIRRYFSKMKYDTISEIDLFSYTKNAKPLHIELMEKFSNFCIWAIRFKQFSFCWEDILKDTKHDPRILELGFLTQTVTIRRLREKLVHEPVHKSLLEFAAAYGLWMTFGDGSGHSKQWEQDVISVLPVDETSLCFFFLVGLMSEKAEILFNLLLPCKLFYSFEFNNLYTSLLEIKVNDSTLKSLSPLLPVIWKIKWAVDDYEFSLSDNHKSLVHYGTHEGSIKQICWFLPVEASMPNEIKVDTLEVVVGFTSKGNIQDTFEKQHELQCKHLWYYFNQPFHPSKIHCCFSDVLGISEFEYLSVGLRGNLLCDVEHLLLAGKFKKKTFYWVKMVLIETEPQLTEDVIHMIHNEKIKRLALEAYGINQQMPNIDKLLIAAAESSELTSFILVKCDNSVAQNFGNKSLLAVDIGYFCLESQKCWDWVQMEGVEVECRAEIKEHFTIACLDFTLCTVSERAAHVIEQCIVKSLTCPAALIIGCRDSWLLCNTLTELGITVDGLILQKGFSSLWKKLRSLQTLTLILKPESFIPRRVEDWLLGCENVISLKGIEIWGIGENLTLARKLVLGISQMLVTSLPPANSQTKAIQVQYLVANCMAVNKWITVEEFSAFADIVYILKQPLVGKNLPRLEIVPTVTSSSERLISFSLRHWFASFPLDQGFRTSCDYWGEKKDDTIKSRMMNERNPRSVERISVTFDISCKRL